MYLYGSICVYLYVSVFFRVCFALPGLDAAVTNWTKLGYVGPVIDRERRANPNVCDNAKTGNSFLSHM